MSVLIGVSKSHGDACNLAEMTRQTAVAAAENDQASVRATEITFLSRGPRLMHFAEQQQRCGAGQCRAPRIGRLDLSHAARRNRYRRPFRGRGTTAPGVHCGGTGISHAWMLSKRRTCDAHCSLTRAITMNREFIAR
jgi:hypothetical protein